MQKLHTTSKFKTVSTRNCSKSPSKRRQTTSGQKQNGKQIVLIVSIAFVLLLASVLLFVAFRGLAKNELLGVWQYDQYTQYEFSEKGQGCLCVDDVHYEYKYSTSGETLKLDFTDDVVRDCEYTFSVEAGVLTLIGGEGTDKGTYQLNYVR